MNKSDKVCQFFLRGRFQGENCEFKQVKLEKSSTTLAEEKVHITEVSKKEKENNIPTEVLEYLENIERENQKQKEALGFMDMLGKKYENLNTQNQNLELHIQTLNIKIQNFENKNKNLEAQAKNFENQAKNLEEARLCKICMEDEICYAFIPCGHQISCENCVTELKNCPICRKKITKCFKTYLS